MNDAPPRLLPMLARGGGFPRNEPGATFLQKDTQAGSECRESTLDPFIEPMQLSPAVGGSPED